MLKFGEVISKHKTLILIIAVILLIPSAYGYIKTRVNYDILSYLPKDIETMEGQDILVDEFGTGAFSMFVVEGMPDKDVAALKEKMWRRLSGMTVSPICQYLRRYFPRSYTMHSTMTTRMPL